jgi:energy-converting hydrogenase A subunit M
MTEFLYEKDLRQMKFNILISSQHDLMIRQIAGRLDMAEARLRMVMIRQFDMSLLENLQARWEMGQKYADTGDPVARELGCELFTRFIPLVDQRTMQAIYEETKAMIASEQPTLQALDAGKARIREAILS